MDVPVSISFGDPIDRADIEIQRTIDMGIANARAQLNAGPRLSPKGICYNCDEPFEMQDRQVKLFCDADCRDDYERITANRKLK